MAAALVREGKHVLITTPGADPRVCLAGLRPDGRQTLVVDQAEEAISRIQAFKLRAWCIGDIARRSKDDDQEQVLINF